MLAIHLLMKRQAYPSDLNNDEWELIKRNCQNSVAKYLEETVPFFYFFICFKQKTIRLLILEESVTNQYVTHEQYKFQDYAL